MSFWDGTRWVPETDVAPPIAAKQRTAKARSLPFLTIAFGLLLLVPVLAWGSSRTPNDQDLVASGPTVTITGVGVPGQLVVIDGQGFKPHQVYQVHWDSGARAVRLVWPSASGRFHGHLRIPATASGGTHVATFSLVDRAAALRVAKGTLQMSALVHATSVVRVSVRVRGSKTGAVNGSKTTSDPTPTPNPASGPTPTPRSTPTPPSGSTPAGKTVTVSSIPSLLATLADDSVGTIVVANGTYHVSPTGSVASNSLWIGGDKYANRTHPVLVKAETRGGVTFDGGGGSGYAGLSFEDGAHDQTWDGFVFANMRADASGIVEVGGYVPRRTPHDITMRFITIKASCTGQSTSANATALEHAFYISNAKTVGPNDLLFEDITVDGSGGLASAFQFDHGDAANPNASNMTVRRLDVTGTQQAIILWQPTVHNITFDDVTISGASRFAVRYESVGATGIVMSNITSTGTGSQGFYSSMGSTPPGLTMTNDSLR